MNAVKSSLSGEWRVVSMLDQISIIDEASKYRYWTSIAGPSFNLHVFYLALTDHIMWNCFLFAVRISPPKIKIHDLTRDQNTKSASLRDNVSHQIVWIFFWKIKRYPPYTTPWIISKKSTDLVQDLVLKPWYLTARCLGDRQVSCSQRTKTEVRNVINKVTSMQDDPEKIVEAIEKGFQKHK